MRLGKVGKGKFENGVVHNLKFVAGKRAEDGAWFGDVLDEEFVGVHFVHGAFGGLYVTCGWFRASMQERSPTKELCTDALKVMRTGPSHRP